MRNKHNASALLRLIYRAQDIALVQAVKVARRFVEHNHRRIAEECPGKAYSLLLAVGEQIAELADICVVAVWQGHDEIVYRGFFRRFNDLLMRGVVIGYFYIGLYRIVEKLRLLTDKALVASEARGLYISDILAAHLYAALLNIPEAHHELERGGLARTARARYADYLIRLNGHIEAVKNFFIAVSKSDIFVFHAVESNCFSVCVFFDNRGLIEYAENSFARRESVGKISGKSRERGDGAERAHHRNGRNYHSVETDNAFLTEGYTREQHCSGKEYYRDIRNGSGVTLYPLEPVLEGVQLVGLFVHFFKALVGAVISYRLKQPAHTVEHKARESAGAVSVGHACILVDPRGHQRNHRADRYIGGERNEREPNAVAPDKNKHNKAGQYRNADRRYRVRIEHLKQLYVARYNRNKVAFVLALKLCGGESAHSLKDLIADKRQQLECYIMVARLFAVMQKSPQNGKNYNADAAGFYRCSAAYLRSSEQSQRTCDGYLNGAQESEHTEQNRKAHKAGKRLDEDYESAHYTQTALFSFHTAAASFEYFSS